MQEATKFTHGEWRVDLSQDAIVVGDEDYPPPLLFMSYTKGRDERIANLHLASAAPNLLASLQEAIELYEAIGAEEPLHPHEYEWMAKAKAAIAKATAKGE